VNQRSALLAQEARATMRDLVPWLPRAGAIAAVACGLALSAPLIWSAVSAGLGLFALGLIAGCGTLVLQALPLLLQKLENRLLAARKAEARNNPIEQLQNDCIRRELRLLSFRKALVQIGGQIENMRQMIDDRRQSDPAHVLVRQERAVDKMAQFYELNLRRLQEAQEALEDFRHQVQQKLFEWHFAQAGQQVMAALRPSEIADLMQDLMTDEALRSVQTRFNAVFAELDVEMRAIDSPTRGLLDTTQLEGMELLQMPSVPIPGRLP
jgi:hypothetical protein